MTAGTNISRLCIDKVDMDDLLGNPESPVLGDNITMIRRLTLGNVFSDHIKSPGRIGNKAVAVNRMDICSDRLARALSERGGDDVEGCFGAALEFDFRHKAGTISAT